MYPRITKTAGYGRVYEVEKGIFFASVTTILRYGLPLPEFLLKWMIQQSGGDYDKHLHANNEASEIGTAVHDLIERVLAGEEIKVSDNPLDHVKGKGYYPTYNTSLSIRKGMQSFMAFWKHTQPAVESVEKLLFCTDKFEGQYMYPFCGRCDMVATIEGERWLLDVKTSKVVKNVLNYKLQLSIYKMLWDAMHPDKPIVRMGILWCKKDFAGSMPPKSVLEPIEYSYDPKLVSHVYAIFQECYDGFKLGNPKLKPEPPKVFSLAQ